MFRSRARTCRGAHSRAPKFNGYTPADASVTLWPAPRARSVHKDHLAALLASTSDELLVLRDTTGYRRWQVRGRWR